MEPMNWEEEPEPFVTEETGYHSPSGSPFRPGASVEAIIHDTSNLNRSPVKTVSNPSVCQHGPGIVAESSTRYKRLQENSPVKSDRHIKRVKMEVLTDISDEDVSEEEQAGIQMPDYRAGTTLENATEISDDDGSEKDSGTEFITGNHPIKMGTDDRIPETYFD